jgi:hypothetical protein
MSYETKQIITPSCGTLLFDTATGFYTESSLDLRAYYHVWPTTKMSWFEHIRLRLRMKWIEVKVRWSLWTR